MNRVKPRGPSALTALCVLAVIMLATGCGAAAPGGSSVPGASSSANRTSAGQPGATADSGMAGCTALLGTHQAAANKSLKIRTQFARSRWPDLRAAGVSYVDLVLKLQTARADGYQTVWFYQRLSLACARHGWDHLPEGTTALAGR